MGQGEDSCRPTGCLEVEARWPAQKEEDNTCFFLLGRQVGPVHVSTNRIFFANSALTGFGVNSRSTRGQCELQKLIRKAVVFLRLKRKVMVFFFSKFRLQCHGFMLTPHPLVNVHRRKQATRCHVILTGGSLLSESLLISWNLTSSAHC
jgi:hypothetical protein